MPLTAVDALAAAVAALADAVADLEKLNLLADHNDLTGPFVTGGKRICAVVVSCTEPCLVVGRADIANEHFNKNICRAKLIWQGFRADFCKFFGCYCAKKVFLRHLHVIILLSFVV